MSLLIHFFFSFTRYHLAGQWQTLVIRPDGEKLNSAANHHMKMRFLGDMGSGDNVFSPFCLLLEKK
jgi:hypothetical protein